MKYFYFLGLLFLSFACKKDKEEFNYHGIATAMFNGKKWESTKVRCGVATQCYRGKLFFNFEIYDRRGFKRESLTISNIPVAKGIYALYPSNFSSPQNCGQVESIASYHTLQDDGDVLLDSYDAISSPDNNLTIEEYNERTGEIYGRFAVTFKMFDRLNPNSPDTIKVTNGSFYTKISDK